MSSPLASLIQAGTKLWLDSVDPDLVVAARGIGATGATSNPIIIGDLINSGRYDQELSRLISEEKLSTYDTLKKYSCLFGNRLLATMGM